MAKPLVFNFAGQPVALQLNKVDRSRLYGFKELLVLDEEGEPCELATLAEDGRKLIGRGGTGVGWLTADGHWVNREDLQPVNLEGEHITPVRSSFGQTISLDRPVSVEQLLDHNIRLVYHLQPDEAPVPDELMESLRGGTIYQFEYSYRGGLVADAGFLLANETGDLFLLVGEPAAISLVGLQQTAPLSTGDEPADDDGEDDAMDFGMI